MLPHMQECGMALCLASDVDKLLVVFDSNQLVLFDMLNQKLHDWSKETKLPSNFLNRYNRIIGAEILTDSKFLLYSNYTYCVLDVNQTMPDLVEIVQNHPGKSIEGK